MIPLPPPQQVEMVQGWQMVMVLAPEVLALVVLELVLVLVLGLDQVHLVQVVGQV
jgi:hypothetical protein